MILTPQRRIGLVLLALTCLGGGWLLIAPSLPTDGVRYVMPALVSMAVFAGFSVLLHRKLQENLLGDLGFLYMAINTAYTVLPAIGFAGSDLTNSGPLSLLFPDPAAIATHLWRMVLYEVGVGVGYLWLRGRAPSLHSTPSAKPHRDGFTIIAVIVMIVVCIASMNLLSAPVENYWEHYLRYNHLSWPLKKFVSVCIRLSLGLYCVLLVFLFRNYARCKWIIPPVVVILCAHEISYSFGARIQAMIILLETLCCYHFMVKRISFRWAAIAVTSMLLLFSIVELVRLPDFDVANAKDAVADGGLQPASEFGSVFFSSFHLYNERAAGTLPPREWPMFFQDAISLVTFGDFNRYNAMDWYTRNYYPDIEVSPFTLGPIADSAIWGGMWDLVLRSIVNGLFFAYIMRWFLKYRERWWGMVIYSYCYATCILTLKYSVFSDLNLILKTLLPCILIVQGLRMIRLPSGPARVARAVTPA